MAPHLFTLLALFLVGCLSDANPATSDATDATDARANDAQPGGDAQIQPLCVEPGPVQVREISAGDSHTCAVLTDGRLYCWGVGGAGQLGYGDRESVGDNEPPADKGAVELADECVLQVATGGAHTCVLLEAGGVRCWGRGDTGALGVAVGDDVLSPPAADVPLTELGGATVVQVAAGDRHTCVRLDDGNVRCWGSNDRGQLGFDSITPSRSLATNVDLGGVAKDVALGLYHTCVALDDGRVKCWGAGDDGRLGYNGVGNVVPSAAGPALMLGGSISDLSVGDEHSCVVLTEGEKSGLVRCWGLGVAGRLGNEDVASVGDNEHPATVSALDLGAEVGKIRAGGFHTCALVAGSARCWGDGSSGALGYTGSVTHIGDSELHPLREDLVTGFEPLADLATGREHTCALSVSGRVRCWGRSDLGRLGHGDGRAVGGSGDAINVSGDVPVWCGGAASPCP